MFEKAINGICIQDVLDRIDLANATKRVQGKSNIGNPGLTLHLKYALAYLAYLQNKEMNIALFLRNIYLGFKTYKN